jgi:hypothetical protein
MKLAALSTSETVILPVAVCTTSVSVSKEEVEPPTTAASLVPLMVTVMVLAVPSLECTTKVSVALAPVANWFCSDAAL